MFFVRSIGYRFDVRLRPQSKAIRTPASRLRCVVIVPRGYIAAISNCPKITHGTGQARLRQLHEVHKPPVLAIYLDPQLKFPTLVQNPCRCLVPTLYTALVPTLSLWSQPPSLGPSGSSQLPAVALLPTLSRWPQLPARSCQLQRLSLLLYTAWGRLLGGRLHTSLC